MNNSSLVDRILSRYGMKWETGPCRIINSYGVVVQKKHFDLRDKTLKAQQNLGISNKKFNKPYPDTLDNN